ncbi:hypothetical protein CDAR_120481 [Caerostris darwini]|uniref:Uncharacterized protein n=1 Tax=Caerostris darwini TaxID=1538125 RepID=A0AAV4W6V2_9ARAC|nr:hypothetical protein CDAR_120481 [Caerostris darwini]
MTHSSIRFDEDLGVEAISFHPLTGARRDTFSERVMKQEGGGTGACDHFLPLSKDVMLEEDGHGTVDPPLSLIASVMRFVLKGIEWGYCWNYGIFLEIRIFTTDVSRDVHGVGFVNLLQIHPF